MNRKRFSALCLLIGMFLSACSVTSNPLPDELRSTMFIAGYDVKYSHYNGVEDRSVRDLPLTTEFVLRSDNDKSETGALTISDEEVGQIQEFLAKLEVALLAEFEQDPSGETPIILEVNITRYDRHDTKSKLLLGKSDGVLGEVTFVNANTDEIVGIYPAYGNWQSFGLVGVLSESIMTTDINSELASDFARNLRLIAEIP